ncbi:MAG: nucleotide exchange factor GrpE [Candidatus Saccharibacteria bacterium]|nr:nucleotide exchange factor GrpE [Candidatus Saccharibacteria bacterium]
MSNDGKKQKEKGKKRGDQRVEELEQQVAELTEALQRERADADNVRRRAEADRSSMADYHKSKVIEQLLPIIDNFERALKHTPNDLKGSDYVKGVQGIVKQFEATLKAIGVTRIETVGQEFNPELHEAVSMEEGEGDKEVVSEELQSGYRLHDQVVRPAMVKVKPIK